MLCKDSALCWTRVYDRHRTCCIHGESYFTRWYHPPGKIRLSVYTARTMSIINSGPTQSRVLTQHKFIAYTRSSFSLLYLRVQAKNRIFPQGTCSHDKE